MKIEKRESEKISHLPAGCLVEGRAATILYSLFSILFFLSTVVYADGGRVGEIFNYGAGARPVSMGGAFTAISRDASSVYYNPSGLGMLTRRNVQFMHSSLFEEASYDFIGYAQNFSNLPGGWGLDFIRLASGDVEGRDLNNVKTENFSYSETAFAIATGIKGIYSPKLAIGAAFKFLNRSLADSSDTHFAFDLGFQYSPMMKGKLDLGLTMNNIVSFKSGDTSDTLPILIRAGASYKLTSEMILAADLSDNGDFRVGTEYAMALGSVRFGFDGSNASFGFGTVAMNSYNIDFAMTKHSELGVSNKISLGYNFGKSGKSKSDDKPKLLAKNYIEDAEKAFNEQDYVVYLDNLAKAMALDYSLQTGKWGEMYKRAELLANGLNLRYSAEKQKKFKRKTEQAALAKKAFFAYINAQELKSILYAHACAGANLEESVFKEFLHLISAETGIAVKTDEILPKISLIKEKMRKSESYFFMQKFNMAAKECEEVLLLNENNPLAWTRLGSSYFAIGNLERSKQAYLKAYELDPDNESVVEFMRMQGWKIKR